jgi:hypothetical protein
MGKANIPVSPATGAAALSNVTSGYAAPGNGNPEADLGAGKGRISFRPHLLSPGSSGASAAFGGPSARALLIRLFYN